MELNSTSNEPKKIRTQIGENETTPKSLEPDIEFKKKINESKRRLADKVLEKRGRGRPKRDLPDSGKIKARPESEPTASTETVSKIQETPNIAVYIKAPLQFISKIPAQNYGIPELALDDMEAMACADSLNQCLQAFAPNVGAMSPQTAAIFSAASVFGSIGFQKYMIFKEKKGSAKEREKIFNPDPEPPQNLNPDLSQMGTGGPSNFAGDYFQTLKN